MKYLRLLGVISIAVIITACGSPNIEGTYTAKDGTEITFQSNGKMIIQNKEVDYVLKGNRIKFKGKDIKIKTATLEKDGSITLGGGYGKLMRNKDGKPASIE